MVKLQVFSDRKNILPLIQDAISFKIKRTKIGLNKTEESIRKFEKLYKVSSTSFLNSYTAEDLTGGDNDYISWMGEINLRESLLEELNILNEIEYVPQRLS
jgi:hypothetical protein